MNRDEFIKELKNININLNDETLEKLDNYKDILLEYNLHTNLTAIKEENMVYLKHFYDSLTIYKYIDEGNLLDIGTGAGFPGMVLAIVKPNLKVTLLDSNNKKTKFLEYLKKELNINNVEIVHERAEDYIKNNREKFDYITSRAMASLRILCELSIPGLKIGGKFIAMKGNLDSELEEAIDTINILNSKIEIDDKFNLPIEFSNRENLIIKKISSNDEIYPRNYDRIIKKPLVKKQ